MRFCHWALGVAAIALAGGCATSRYSGRVIDDGYQSDLSCFRNRYEIRRLAFDKGYQPFYRQIAMGNETAAKKFMSADIDSRSGALAGHQMDSIVFLPALGYSQWFSMYMVIDELNATQLDKPTPTQW